MVAHLQTFHAVVDAGYRTVRNGARQTFLTGQSLQGQPPPQHGLCLNELQVCVRMRMRVGVCGYACACARPALDAYRCFQEWWRICRRFMPSLTQAAGMQPP